MDIFKGIGDFFGGLFGQKKKREDEQQPQQQQSAVSFNSTPKLGDNFANNLSNPTQPQQPKEFAKSSVDLNPVKPVQPVQPQMNREQERQQLTDKYRQEETDRYNQGSDHVANFLNDIFSGGKTAQMRENTINQNIQNRVNAEMLRKYGPDDQQVKQNIAQTSQNINKNATAVSDFTKNYNNNLQQTVVAPVSAVKGAANSVVETVPKVSGAITELGANTIKLFDEDNQFANNLIKRVRADREKNIVRKTLNDATGLTDQDNKMAYGLGNSGARMAIDAAMTPVTGGIAPAVVHGVEAHSEMMDHLDNIEARKKAEAAARGETYTPSSFTSRYLASTANAGAQAAIEKLGIDNLTGKIGGKFAKNMVGRAITGALGEAGEEGAQQYAENFTKKLFDNKQDIHENVAESALMGGIMGGAGKMAFGGMESVKNPYNTNNGKFNSYDPKALIEAERNAVRTGLFNKNNANSDLSLVDKEFNVGAPERLAKALRNGADGDISFMRMPNRLLGEVNAIRKEKGLSNINNNTVVAYKNAINNHLAKRIGEGMSPESSAHIAADSIINPYSNVYAGTKSKNGYNRDHIHLVAAPNGDKYNSSTVSEFNGGLSLKNIAPRDISEIKKSQAMLGAPLVGHKPEDIGISSGLGDIAAPQGVHTNNIAQNTQKVNNGYRYSDEIRNKIAQDLDERLLRVRDNTGETLADFETRLKQEGATEQEIEPYKNSFIRRAKMFLEEPRSMPGWSLDQENKQNNETNLADFNFQPSAINENTKLYHGTNGKVAEEIRKNGFKRGNELDENAYFGGGHDVANQDSVSFSTNRNVSENFAINGRDSGKGSGALIEARLLPDARVVETDAEIYAEDLNEVTEQLRKQGVDAVFLKSNGEDELVVLNPEKVDRNILIERYKLANQQKQALTAKLEDLKARHQNLTGDEDLVFNIFKDELQKNALGYFDPKTNQINLNDLTFETLNHEIGHKIFSRVPLEQKADLIDEVRRTFGDEALVQQYGKDYGDDLNLLAEEKLADGFSDYYQGRLNGEESIRLGAKLGIPPKILAYYDRMIEAIKSVFGATNELKKFYAEIETGKFTQDYKQNAPVYNENPVYKIAFPKVQESDLITPELEKYGIKPTKTEYNQALEYVLMEERPELFERYEKARLGLEALEENIEFNQFTPTELKRLYGKNYAEHLDRGMISQMVRKDSVNGLDQAAMRGDMSEVDMEDYVDRLNNYYETKREVKDLEQEIREAYADPELRKDAKQALWFNKYEEIENAVANLRQNGVDIDFDGYVQLKYGDKAKSEAVKAEEKLDNEDVATENAKMDENIVHETQPVKKTEQKTRKFAETVLDIDTPPKDFVKLMHAGDESLKYTPKKNSELWNKATKSVQESPERVFNELENTRVANDETMAKGIALAKHYQAMGDDLKASELYVELAKKATEAGRTVQALNLMRRTTPEGVLMSTMREVENYNDKMKDKPNKQINITPEQRAEFLGKLRKAYAMPEGDLKEIRARRIAIGEAIREIRDQIPSSKWDKFTTLWKAGLLTAPTTHIRNIAGNIINGGSEKTAQTIGSAFDWMISKGTGRRTLTRNGFSGMLKGIKEGSGYAKDIMKTGIDTTGEIDSKWRDQRTNYGNSLGGKLAQGYTDFVFNSLNASDKIFRGSAEKMSIANQAKAIAINEKLRGEERKARIRQLINNPTNSMLENAKHDADMATFQQDTGLGQFVAKGRQAGGITKKATDIIMPFTGVPSAVADQLVNYSPLGVAKGVKQVADLRKAVKNGLDDSTITALQRKASTQLGRGITGTMLLGAGLALANAGLLSGQPRDDNEKRQWAAEGKKANALKIGDTWVPIDTLSPQMILAAAGANAESRVKNGQGVLEASLNTLGDGAKSWTEQGYMTGIKDAIDTATGDKDLNKYAIQQATSLIPNGIRKLAAATDNKARQANYGDLGESIQNSIPLWRNGLPAKYDIYGREIKTNPWSIMLDPQKSSTENPTELSRKINEFRKNNPELDSVIPKTAPNKITINGQTRELTSSERSEYQRLLGENISKYMMSGGFNDSSFNKLSEGDKKDMLEKIQSDVKKSVEMALFNKTSKQTNDNAKKIAQNIVNGGNNDLKPEWKTREQSKDELYKRPELEYERLKEEYDKKKKNGDFDGRKVQELQERMKVRRAQVGKDTPKSYRDMYSSGKQSFNMLLKEMDSDQERNEAMTKVLEYGDKLVAAGLEKKNKFRDKYGNVDFEDSKDKKGRGRGRKSGSSASSVNTADITSTLSKNLLKTRGSQAKALNAMPTISVRNSSLQARAKRSAVRFKK